MHEQLLMLLGMSFMATVSVAGESAPAAEMFGTWEVEKVAVDARDKPHWEFKPDDPQLMGRELAIDGERIHFDTGHQISCKPANWLKHSTDWKSLFGVSLFRSPSSGRAEPTPADYGFKVLPGQRPVIAYSFCTPARAGNRWVMGPWLVAFGSNRIMLHLDNQTMLVLARRPPDATPRASFACSKAASPTEKAICGSFTLAGWDRSVALAWRYATENGADPALREEQKEWLRTRDACGADATCLEKQMRDRAADLSRQ
jgi:hypothetical protein